MNKKFLRKAASSVAAAAIALAPLAYNLPTVSANDLNMSFSPADNFTNGGDIATEITFTTTKELQDTGTITLFWDSRITDTTPSFSGDELKDNLDASISGVTVTQSDTGDYVKFHLSSTLSTGTYKIDIEADDGLDAPTPAGDEASGYGSSLSFALTTNEGDSDAGVIYVSDDNDVNVSATVAPTLSFNIRNMGDTADTNVCDFGTVSTSTGVPDGDSSVDAGLGECGYTLAVATNATSGADVQIVADADMTNGTSDLTNIVADSDFTPGDELYGIDFVKAAIDTNGVRVSRGIDYDVLDKASIDGVPVPTGPAEDFISTGEPFVYTAGINADDVTAVVHGLTISSATPAGTYTQQVTYTVTATF